MVLDLSRNCNDLVEREHFRQQRFRDAVDASTPGCYYGKMDLADCFYSFPVHKDSQHLLAFELGGSYYRFRRLPMGLSSSPEWCERFMSVIDFELRRRGVRHIRYCDDFLFIASSPQEVRRFMAITRSVLTEHGLQINEKKTEGPAQRIVFLGLGLDSVQQSIFVPPEKRSDLFSIIGTLRGCETVTRKQLQSIAGKFNFVASALPGARPFFRKLIDAVRGLPSPQARTAMTSAMREDLEAWRHWLTSWDGRARWRAGDRIVITHDASLTGFGFYLSELPACFPAHRLPVLLRQGNGYAGMFDGEHAAPALRSIDYGELFAMATSVAMFAPYLRDCAVLLKTDNKTDVSILNRQRTSCPDLLRLLRGICATCAHYNIDIEAEHIPGVDNVLADFLSRSLKHNFRTRVPTHIAPGTIIHHILSSGLCLAKTGESPLTVVRFSSN